MKMVLVFLEEVMGGRTDCLMEKNAAFIDLKLDPENLYKITKWPTIKTVYKFSGSYFIQSWLGGSIKNSFQQPSQYQQVSI